MILKRKKETSKYFLVKCDDEQDVVILKQHCNVIDEIKPCIRPVRLDLYELTDEQCIEHLQDSGWLVEHDRIMTTRNEGER